MSAAIGSMKELGVADWRAADKAEPVKNQDCRDYTMTTALHAEHMALTDNCFAARRENCRKVIFCGDVAFVCQVLLTDLLSLCIIGGFPDSKAAFYGRGARKRKYFSFIR